MRINDLFSVIASVAEFDIEKKNNLYKLVRNIIKNYRTLDIENDVYDLWDNEEEMNAFLEKKKLINCVEVSDIFDIPVVEDYIQKCIASEEVDDDIDTDIEPHELPLPQKLEVTVQVSYGWIWMFLMFLGTVNVGVTSYVLFKQQHMSQ